MKPGKHLLPSLLMILLLINRISGYGIHSLLTIPDFTGTQELRTYRDSQILYNGKVWYRKNFNIRGNEFFVSALWNKGEVTIKENTFRGVDLRYDILNDELLIRRSDGLIIIMNREMVTGFRLDIGGQQYNFVNILDTANGFRGYANIIFPGKTTLLRRFVKEILPLGYQKTTDIYVESDYLYILKKGEIFRIRSRKGLLDILGDREKEVRDFVRTGKIDFSTDRPESFIPVLRYYDSLDN